MNKINRIMELFRSGLIPKKIVLEELGISEYPNGEHDDALDAFPYQSWLLKSKSFAEYNLRSGLINWRVPGGSVELKKDETIESAHYLAPHKKEVCCKYCHSQPAPESKMHPGTCGNCGAPFGE